MAWKKLYIKPNKAAQKAAKRGLEARKKAPKSKKGGLDAIQAAELGIGSGVLRARDIVAGKRVNAYQVNAFFNRHRKNYLNAKFKGLKPVESRAIQSWLLWGGEPLRKQAEAAVRKDKAKRNPLFFRRRKVEPKWKVVECERWDGYIGYKIERRGKQTVGGCWYKTRQEADAAADALNSDPTRNPDHDNVIDLEGRRRELEFERLLGTVDIDDIDPIDPEEDSVQHVLDAVDYYCEVRNPPRVRNPLNVPDNVLDPLIYLAAKNEVKGRVAVWPSAYASGQLVQEYKRRGGRYANPSAKIDKSGRISYGDYYFLPDGSGGYDMYFQDEVVASGIESVAEARREVDRHRRTRRR